MLVAVEALKRARTLPFLYLFISLYISFYHLPKVICRLAAAAKAAEVQITFNERDYLNFLAQRI